MAERRMFAKTIIDSDMFLDMPLSAQALYFHLAMRADDDGFVNNPKKIQRMINCTDDDLKLLIAKQFIIPFESGVVVIKHWKIHNYIRTDRYKETNYKEEKALLELDVNNSYRLTSGIPTDYQLVDKRDTQDRLGKDRLGKDNIPYVEIQEAFNSICTSFPKVIKLTQARKNKLRKRWEELKSLDKFIEIFTKMEQSDFMRGKNKHNWKATFDWVISNDTNYVKVLEGNYDNRRPNNPEPDPETAGIDFSRFNAPGFK